MATSAGTRHRTVAWLVFAAVWLAYAATAGGTMATTDAVVTFEVARSIVDRGALDIPDVLADTGWRGSDGRSYAPFGIGQSLYDIPFLLAGRLLVDRVGLRLGDPDAVPKALVAGASTIAAAAAAAFGFLLAWRLSSHMRASVAAALVLAFGTMLWPYARFGFNAALTAGALAAGVYGTAAGVADRSRPLLAAGGAALGVALLTRHEMTLAAAVCLIWLAWSWRAPVAEDRGSTRPERPAGRTGPMIAAAAPVCGALAISLALNAIRYGTPLRSGFAPTFSFAGFAAYLVSPSGALLLYAPAAIAAVGLVPAARRSPLARLLLGVSVVMFLFYSSLEDWLGTRSYGPRYLVPLLPLLLAPLAVWISSAGSRRQQAFLGALCAASVLVQLPPVVVDFSRAGIEAAQPPQKIRRNDWRWSPQRITAAAAIRAAGATGASFASGRRETPPPRSAAGGELRMPFGLDFWWVHLFHLGVLPRAWALASAVTMLAGALALGAFALRLAGGATPAFAPPLVPHP
jgi:hypothetical protein